MEKNSGDNGDSLFFGKAGDASNLEVVYVNEKDCVENSIHGSLDDFATPTEEEMETLRHVSDQINWSTYLIAFVELAERFSYYGSVAVWTNFIQQPLPKGSVTGAGGKNGQSGALGKGQRIATSLTTVNTFWTYITPLFGAYIADTYLGRYKTIMISIFICLIGHIVLVISAIPPVIVHSDRSLACLVVAMIVMGLGTGGFKSNISPLIAEQQRNLKPFVRVNKNGERVVVDPAMTTARIYMWFYFFINVGALVGPVGMTYGEKYIGYWFSYMLPTIVYLCCPLVLWLGQNRYRHSPPEGSVLGQALRLWRYAASGRWSLNPIATWRNMTASDFWESAKPSKVPVEKRPRWMTFDDNWVEEVRRGLKACQVFVWYPVYWLAYNQIVNNLTSQAAVLVTNGVPNDVVNNLDPFALLILIPVHDLLIYPTLMRMGFRVTPIRKITLGFIVGSLAMIWAAVLQAYIYKTSPCGRFASGKLPNGQPCPVAPLSVWIQTGSYVLIAASEIYASITGLEYAFTKAPKNMKSLVTGVFLFTSAISSAIGEGFVALSTDPLLVWNYGIMAVLSFCGGIMFWFTFHQLDRDEEKLNRIADGKFNEEN